ncbi:hypothetical protein OIU84_012010 [Salix udensis]|uniref:HIT domain-containing protein n=1 Tax=Salix udensis TaxID=889485 RepID=A0AAD6NSR6_9ROSI|nr:hypothetical protein OIU84_012010 [Salix udensis]
MFSLRRFSLKQPISREWSPEVGSPLSAPISSLTLPLRLHVLSSSLTSSASINDAAGDTRNHQLDCVFCRIVRGESPAFKLYEDETCLCILDTSPVSPGHSLIIPKSHFSCLEATPPSVVAAMCSKVPSIGNAIMKANGSDSFNLLVNNGAAAGQVIFHVSNYKVVSMEK